MVFRTRAGIGLPVVLQPQCAPALDQDGFIYTISDTSLCVGTNEAQLRGVRHEYALDSLLRILLSVLLLSKRGFLLHAATVVRERRAYIFTGRSGAGKSTVASLSPAGSVLTDEISLLRFTESGWQAYGTPFWGGFRASGTNRRVPVGAIYSLVQSRDDQVERLTPKQAVRVLLPNVLFFNSGKRENQKLLAVLIAAAQQIPFYRLRFRRNAAFWRVIL